MGLIKTVTTILIICYVANLGNVTLTELIMTPVILTTLAVISKLIEDLLKISRDKLDNKIKALEELKKEIETLKEGE